MKQPALRPRQHHPDADVIHTFPPEATRSLVSGLLYLLRKHCRTSATYDQANLLLRRLLTTYGFKDWDYLADFDAKLYIEPTRSVPSKVVQGKEGKLSADDINTMRAYRKAGYTLAAIAERYDISAGHASKICQGDCYRRVAYEEIAVPLLPSVPPPLPKVVIKRERGSNTCNFTVVQIHAIRLLSLHYSQSEIAAMYSVTRETISKIHRRHTYQHVPELDYSALPAPSQPGDEPRTE